MRPNRQSLTLRVELGKLNSAVIYYFLMSVKTTALPYMQQNLLQINLFFSWNFFAKNFKSNRNSKKF